MDRCESAAGWPTVAGLWIGAPLASATQPTLWPLRPSPPDASCSLKAPRMSPLGATAARTWSSPSTALGHRC
eukprot:8853685-Alexandrium_andersonii.AAC.1